MKKRFFCILLLFLMLLSGCSKRSSALSEVSFSETNFNNTDIHALWAQDDSFLYRNEGFYDPAYYLYANGTSHRLFRDSDFGTERPDDFELLDIFPCGSRVYLQLYSENCASIYYCDLSGAENSLVRYFPAYYSFDKWGIIGKQLVYLDDPDGSGSLPSTLSVYNMEEETTEEICTDVVDFGIVGDKLRYIVSGGNYTLYEYSENTSQLLGQFDAGSDMKNHMFNYTEEYLIVFDSPGHDSSNVVIHHIPSGNSITCSMSCSPETLVACDEYAYAVAYGTNLLYQIQLSTGAISEINVDLGDFRNFYAVSDSLLYVTEGTEGLFGTAKTIASRIDPFEETKEELLTY